MEYDAEKEQREYEEREAKRRAEMAALCAELKVSLEDPDRASPLHRQAEILGHLLTAVMRRHLRRDLERGCFDYKDIDVALRIQKQCLDTLKAAGSIDYMQAIISLTTGVYPPIAPPHPHPPQIPEQTIKET